MRLAVLASIAALGLGGASKPPTPDNRQPDEARAQKAGPAPTPHTGKDEGQRAAATSNGGTQGLSAYERESLTVDRGANSIAKAANTIAQAQRDYAFWQLMLSGAGVVFTGIAAFFAYRATHWAKEAASHTKRSADADNAALVETRAGMAAAREDAGEQARRFRAENRPWVGVTEEKLLSLTLDPKGAKAEVVLYLENPGHTPAHRVEVYARLIPETRPDETVRDIKERFAVRPRLAGDDFIGVLLPGQRLPFEFEIESRPLSKPPKEGFIFTVAGFITYQSELAETTEPHASTFVFRIAQIGSKRLPWDGSRGVWSKDQLQMKRWPHAWLVD